MTDEQKDRLELAVKCLPVVFRRHEATRGRDHDHARARRVRDVRDAADPLTAGLASPTSHGPKLA